MRKITSILFLFFLLKTTFAQKEPDGFAPVTPEDFRIMPRGPDTAAAALILADLGNCQFGGNYMIQSSIALVNATIVKKQNETIVFKKKKP